MQAADLLATATLSLASPAIFVAVAQIARPFLPAWALVAGALVASRGVIAALHALLRLGAEETFIPRTRLGSA